MARVCARYRNYRNYRNEAVPSKASERVEIARRIEEALAGRQGGDRSSGKCLPLESEGKSTDIAAKSVGWSGETYRKAKKVIDSGDEALSIKVLQYC